MSGSKQLSATKRMGGLVLVLLLLQILSIFFGGEAIARQNAETNAGAKVETKQTELPAIHIVFFTPSDLTAPEGVRPRITRIAETAEKFIFEGMKQWGYPAGVTNLFRREADGLVEVLEVKGDKPASYTPYATNYYARDVIRQALKQYNVGGSGNVWWIFVYLGGRRHIYGNWRGIGNSRDGGSAMMSYDNVPGEIKPELGLLKGFNGDYFMKGMVHELCHAFGLPHAGPDRELHLGNSLMGPTTALYETDGYGKADQLYLSESSAAQLWKHPIFSGVRMETGKLPSVKLVDYRANYTRTNDRVTLTGKLVADQPAHSVVVIENLGARKDEHWFRNHSARIDTNGNFQVTFDHPPKRGGEYRIRFCFDNGIVTGDGTKVAFSDPGEIRKGFGFKDGKFEFDE